MAGKGALSSLARMFEGYTLPAKKLWTPHETLSGSFGPRDDLLRSLLLPDEEMLYHGSPSPIHNIENTGGLHLANHPDVSKAFAGYPEGYVAPFAVHSGLIGEASDRDKLLSIYDPVHYWPEHITSDDIAHTFGIDYDQRSYYDELYSRFPGMLTPLSRRVTGQHAHGGLI